VTLTPADIKAQKFPIVFRGYAVGAVDAFLDRVHADLARALADAAAGAGLAAPSGPAGDDRPVASASSEAGTGRPAEVQNGPAARALRTLARAEETAEQVVADATAEAEDIRAGARADAGDIIAAARAESGRIEAESDLRRQREVGALVGRAQQLRAEIDRLSGLERRYRDALQALLAEQQRLLEHRIPVPDAATGAELTSAAEDLDSAA
jgi:DivIVA domain-containing protein